jgi:hypothetical protein
MKKAIASLLLVAGISCFAKAQQPVYVTGGPPPASKEKGARDTKFNLTVFGGYFFEETFQLYNGGSVHLDGGSPYGVSLSMTKDPRVEIELTWQRQITNAQAYYYEIFGNDILDAYVKGDVDIEYFMLGLNRMKSLNDRVTAYGGLSAGMVVFTPQTLNLAAVEKFAVALKGGVNLKITDRIGLKLQPQLYIPIQSFGATAFVGTGGSGVSANGYSSITQFGGIGGLTVSF